MPEYDRKLLGTSKETGTAPDADEIRQAREAMRQASEAKAAAEKRLRDAIKGLTGEIGAYQFAVRVGDRLYGDSTALDGKLVVHISKSGSHNQGNPITLPVSVLTGIADAIKEVLGEDVSED